MIKIDQKTVDEEVYFPHESTVEYKEALAKLKEAIKTGDPMKIDDSVVFLETKVCEITYIKAFHDGMRFILNTMAGKEVIEL